jgi:hypothetical protein
MYPLHGELSARSNVGFNGSLKAEGLGVVFISLRIATLRLGNRSGNQSFQDLQIDVG